MHGKMDAIIDWSILNIGDDSRYFGAQFTLAVDIKNVVDVTAQLIRSKGDVFHVSSFGKRPRVHMTKLGNIFISCLKIDFNAVSRCYPAHRNNPLYIVFRWCCRRLINVGPHINPDMMCCLNGAIDKIRKFGRGKAISRRLDNLNRCERANAKKARQLLVSLRENYSKVLALRLDLEYLSEFSVGGCIGDDTVDFEQTRKHRDQFLHFLRKGPLSEHVAGYIWKMEYGLEKGFHFHFAIFLNGQDVCKDITIGDILGNKWKSLTAGKGMYFNCNKKKEAYAECGIGMVGRQDDQKWHYLEEAIRYMTKIDYYIRFQASEKSRNFGIGGPYRK